MRVPVRGQPRGLERVVGQLVGAGEVVRRAGRDHGQRDAEAARELRRRADRAVAAGDRDPLRARSPPRARARPARSRRPRPPRRARAWPPRAAQGRARPPTAYWPRGRCALRREGTLRPMFGRIDHIGVAVGDLDAAIELHTSAYGMELVHREMVESQGVEAVLLDVGENHVELLAPARRRHAGRQVPGQARAGPAPRRLPGDRHRRRPRRAARGRRAADRRAAAHRDPLLAGRVPASGASGGVLTEIVEPAEVHA